jgi:hypothetical protein
VTADWQAAGLCLIPDNMPLFGDKRVPGMSWATRAVAAKTVCGRCPIEARCLAWALEQEGTAGANGRAGVLGGKSAAERAAIAGASGDEDGAR